MRTLGDTLTAAQKAMGDAKLKLTLGKSGEIAKIYYIDSGDDRIIKVRHIEQEWSQTAQVVVQDSDATLADLDLRAWNGYMGYGYGANYSECAPMEVIAQRTDSVIGGIATSIRMAGVFDIMAVDEASIAYRPDDTCGDTVKTILTNIAAGIDGSLGCFWHCKAYTIIFDSEDDLIDTFMPKDYFSIAPRESRLSAFKKALAFCGCRARVEYTVGEFYGAIHIFVPTVSGSPYDYEYSDDVTGHNFFEKSVRKRLVIPNKVTVQSHPDHYPPYTGSATDSDSYDALGRYITGYQYLRVESGDQCEEIAEAIIKNLRLNAGRGSGFAPMNCGQEVMDYVKITDSRVGDTRIGNIGYIKREYLNTGKPEDFSMEFGFGKMGKGGLPRPAFEQTDLQMIMEYVDERFSELISWLLDMLEVIPKLHVEKQLTIPVLIRNAPQVTSVAVSGIAATTAIGNGNITDLGVPDPTAHGVCYNTTGDPYITDDVTDEGAVTLTGEYTSAMAGLTPETTYYVRAYATNALGTGYGIQVTFTTLAA